MGVKLVDLTGRQDEPAIRRVLEASHGTAEALEEACAHYRSGDWTFIGWQEGGEVLACAGAEQLGSGTIGIYARSQSSPSGGTAVLAARS